MADNKNLEDGSEDKGTSARKKGIALGGGVVGLVAAAYMLFLIAVPGSVGNTPFRGPYVVMLTPEEVQANLRGPGNHYLLMVLVGEYMAYEEDYVTRRAEDPVFQAYVKDALLGAARQKTNEDLDGKVGAESFKEEVRTVLNPLLFPIHIGDTAEATERDSDSGLKPGHSISDATMRDGFRNHLLHVDAPRQTISLDDGPLIPFEGTETDLLVENGTGHTIYVNLVELDSSFVGDVNVGTFGIIRRVLSNRFVVQ